MASAHPYRQAQAVVPENRSGTFIGNYRGSEVDMYSSRPSDHLFHGNNRNSGGSRDLFIDHQLQLPDTARSWNLQSTAPDTPRGVVFPHEREWSPTLAAKDNSESTSSLFGSAISLPKPLEDTSHEMTLLKPEEESLHDISFSSGVTSPNASFQGLDSNSHLLQLMGSNSNLLLPKLKTIELYRVNAKKSNDPEVLLQYARYMLNTAIFMNLDPDSLENKSGSTLSLGSHKKNRSTTSFMSTGWDASLQQEPVSLEEKKALKHKFLKEAVHYLKKLSDKGFTEAQYLLADAYSSGAIGKVDEREAFTLFQGAAKHGHVESAYRTSFCYEVGLGTSRDSRKALEFLKFAATKNHPSAMYKMGIYSFYGRMGLSNSITTKKDGIKWLNRATENANELILAAPYELGKIHYQGFKDIVIQDKVYALDLYRLAASLGHIQSLSILGKHYELGDVIPQDPELSIHYYTQAALGGDAESMLGLCGWFMVGTSNLPKNESELFEWSLKAANLGLPKLQFATGHFLEKGIGCEKNQDSLIKWFQKAAENGDERAVKKLKGTKFEVVNQKKSWVKKLFS